MCSMNVAFDILYPNSENRSYNIAAILTMKWMINRIPMLCYWTVREQKGLYQDMVKVTNGV